MKYFFLFIFTFSLVALFENDARAQTAEPQFFITWRAEQSYAPAIFSGKILPNERTRIAAAAELVQNGKIVDVSQESVYWYVNGTFRAGGKGLRAISFPASRAGGEIDVRVEIDNFRGQGTILVKTVSIPSVPPRAVLQVPPENRALGAQARILARPYFFSVPQSGLAFSWQVNGEPVLDAANPEVLNLSVENLTQNSAARIRAVVSNARDSSEAASAQTEIIFTK